MMVVTVVLLGVVLVAICHQPAPFIRVSERASADGDDAELDGDNVIRYLLFAGLLLKAYGPMNGARNRSETLPIWCVGARKRATQVGASAFVVVVVVVAGWFVSLAIGKGTL